MPYFIEVGISIVEVMFDKGEYDPMIRMLNSGDLESMYNLLKQKPCENLFILWGIEAFGFNSELQVIWGDYDEFNEEFYINLRINMLLLVLVILTLWVSFPLFRMMRMPIH
ncbi:hypothetical protein AWM68_02295 [Fictibacillus phosphorivorans]|uniref:Uncharacterized protein n=1 Tax=Fictibacillus phosphorivorans TaxID=1221500 RepID=A0A163SHN1_9BACL|nr:hypothetical protein [Fictibacillus phosphorivorans]KZE69117.1 hypothetical protein AWM68_02295 [Fictibacillus phosphorivorans]